MSVRIEPERCAGVKAMSRVEVRAAEAHRKTVTSGIQDIAVFLEEMLGRNLVAYITESDVKTVARWSKGMNKPHPGADKKLRDVYQVVRLLQTGDSAHVVRAWMIGMNPQLEDESPSDAIREGHSRAALVAAKAYIAGG